MPKRQPPFVRVEFRCRKQQHLHNAGSPLPSSSCPHGFCSNMQHLGFDPPRPLWLALPIAGPNMVLRPHDINMQIWADNDAKPHNQQIINSPFPPWLPSAHASSTCGKRHSCVLHNFRPPPSLRSQRVIAASNGPNMLTRVRHNLMKEPWKQAGTLKKKNVFTGLDTEKHFNKTLKLLATAWTITFLFQLRWREESRCCLPTSNIFHRLWFHGKIDALESCCLQSKQVRAYYLVEAVVI